jgi:hypothetical protein
MKSALTLAILAALLGGCAIVPSGHGDNRNGYYQQRDYNEQRNYNRGDGNYRDRDNSRYYGNDRYYSYNHDANGDPFQEHGH